MVGGFKEDNALTFIKTLSDAQKGSVLKLWVTKISYGPVAPQVTVTGLPVVLESVPLVTPQVNVGLAIVGVAVYTWVLNGQTSVGPLMAPAGGGV